MVKLCELRTESAICIPLKQKAKIMTIRTSKLCSLEGNIVLNLDKDVDRLMDKLEVSEITNYTGWKST